MFLLLQKKVVVDFLFTKIFTRFGMPREIVSDNSPQFISNLVQGVMEQYKIRHGNSMLYHLQASGQVESTNKVIESILTKTINMHRKYYAKRLQEALRAYRTTWRNSMGHTPYELVYGKQVLLPIEFQIKTFRTAVQLGLDLSEAQQQRLLQLNELDEFRRDAIQHNILIEKQCKRWHDKFIQKKQLQPGDWVLLYDSIFKILKGKFHTCWM